MVNQWDLYEYVKSHKGKPIIARELLQVFGCRVNMVKLRGLDDVELRFCDGLGFPRNPYGQKTGYVARYKIEGEKMKVSTIRKCNGCGYETLILFDNKGERNCNHCAKGKLEIIAEEE